MDWNLQFWIGVILHKGLIVSSDQFVSDNNQRSIIYGSFLDALCTDMEGAAVGHVCSENGVPFCIIRAISDNADDNSSNSYNNISKSTSESAAQVILDALHNNCIH